MPKGGHSASPRAPARSHARGSPPPVLGSRVAWPFFEHSAALFESVHGVDPRAERQAGDPGLTEVQPVLAAPHSARHMSRLGRDSAESCQHRGWNAPRQQAPVEAVGMRSPTSAAARREEPGQLRRIIMVGDWVQYRGPMDENHLDVVTIEGLFGERDLELKMATSGPTVLTGSNGTGKSTILRLVYAVSSMDIATLVNAPIRVLRLSFSHIPAFVMTRSTDRDYEWTFEWGPHRDIVTSKGDIGNLPEWVIDALRDNDFNVQAALDHLLDYVNRSDVRPDEYRAARDLLSGLDPQVLRPSAPAWMELLQDAFPAVFVTDQRLVVEPNKRMVRNALVHGVVGVRSTRRTSTTTRAVEAASSEIASQISRADSDYARNSQLVDRRFPADVIKAMQYDRKTSRKIVEDLSRKVDIEREQLRLVGLLDTDTEYQPELGSDQLDLENVRPVVAEILRSTLAKLEVLRDLANRLTAFKRFLDNRFESKTVVLSRSSGLSLLLKSGKTLRPSQLSSGEQQMIVLAFEILFNTNPGTLVIIDEPEISLHVLWQDSLLEDLQSMGRPSRLQFMMATHSPAILGDYPELERSLDGLLT